MDILLALLAGAIKDNKVGTILGYHSFGKASVQNIRQLQDGSALLVTIAKYQTPSGEDISKKGIRPDIVVKTGKERDLVSGSASEEAAAIEEEMNGKEEKSDVQLKKAEEVIKAMIASVAAKKTEGSK